MDVGVELHDLLPLDVGEHHEGVHRPLDVVWGVLLRLKNGISSIIWEIITGQVDSLSKSETTICIGWEHKKLKLGARNILVQTKCNFGFGQMTLFRQISEPDNMLPHLGCPVSNGFTAYSGSKI